MPSLKCGLQHSWGLLYPKPPVMSDNASPYCLIQHILFLAVKMILSDIRCKAELGGRFSTWREAEKTTRPNSHFQRFTFHEDLRGRYSSLMHYNPSLNSSSVEQRVGWDIYTILHAVFRDSSRKKHRE